jgi:hypothetical protein
MLASYDFQHRGNTTSRPQLQAEIYLHNRLFEFEVHEQGLNWAETIVAVPKHNPQPFRHLVGIGQ